MKIKVWLSIGFGKGASRQDTLDVPDEDLEGMTKDQREDYLYELAQEWANNYTDYGYCEVK